MNWRPIETSPKVGSIWMMGPRGGKFRATWMFGVMGVPGWHCRYQGEWINCGSAFWMPITQEPPQ